MKNVYKSWKTTLLGVVIIGVGIMYIYMKEPIDVAVIAFLFGTAGALLFAKDKPKPIKKTDFNSILGENVPVKKDEK